MTLKINQDSGLHHRTPSIQSGQWASQVQRDFTEQEIHSIAKDFSGFTLKPLKVMSAGPPYGEHLFLGRTGTSHERQSEKKKRQSGLRI